MIAAAVIMIVLVLAVSVAVAASLRSLVADEARTEAHLDSPGTHTLTYDLWPGVDPAVLRVAVTRAGFVGAMEHTAGVNHLRVECADSDRERLRGVLAAGTGVTAVVFEDEHRPDSPSSAS